MLIVSLKKFNISENKNFNIHHPIVITQYKLTYYYNFTKILNATETRWMYWYNILCWVLHIVCIRIHFKSLGTDGIIIIENSCGKKIET